MLAGRIKALFLDLDDTLLINDMDSFAPPYFQALVAKVQRWCSAKVFLEALDAGTRAMWHNNGKNGSNAAVFAREFYPRLGRRPEEIQPLLEDFYTHEFESLQAFTAVDPEARPLVELAKQRGYQLAVTTQPIFPLTAILARLRWADVSAEEFRYDFIASYETMSACKPSPRYFSFVLEHLGRAPAECLMVGDSPDADMGAGKQGIKTYWIDRGRVANAASVVCDGQGSLGELRRLIETGRIDEL
jgi:HAD superfamily hydrolase (TIGR01549 family)